MNLKSRFILLLISATSLTIYSASQEDVLRELRGMNIMIEVRGKRLDQLMPDEFRGRVVKSIEGHESISPYFQTVMLAPPARLAILKHSNCGLVEVEQGAEKLAELAMLREAGKIKHETLAVSNCHDGEKIHILLVNITPRPT